MKWIREVLPRGREAVFAVGLLLVYGLELIFSPDMSWTIWAAQMALGILYVPDAHGLQVIGTGEAFRAMSAIGAFSSIAAAVLLALQIKSP